MKGWSSTGALDDEGELHGGLGHLDGCLGALVPGSVDDVGPVDEFGEGSGVEAEPLARDVGDEAGAGDVGGVVELAALEVGAGAVRLGLPGEEIELVLGREEGALVVIEPPRDAGRGGILEVDDGVLAVDEGSFIEQRPGAVHQSEVGEVPRGADGFAVEAREQGCGAGAVEAMVVVEHPAVQADLRRKWGVDLRAPRATARNPPKPRLGSRTAVDMRSY